MESWEDWDYWLRMSRAGKCFTRVAKELVVYRFYSGTRRDIGVQENQKLLQYLRDKYKGIETMPCCGGKTRNVRVKSKVPQQQDGAEMNALPQDNDTILIVLADGNRGQHKIVGGATGKVYGYRSDGEKFYIHKNDYSARPGSFRIIEETKVVDTAPQATPPPPPKIVHEKPVEVETAVSAESLPVVKQLTTEESLPETFDLQTLPGVSADIARQLNAEGIFFPEDIMEAGVEALTRIKGIGDARAKNIIDSIERLKSLEVK
jgi:predicted flap endonuclease-1-like 5' DNA nuclease